MTAEEAKIHFQKLAQDSGLSKEQTDAVLQAMDHDKFRGAVAQGYKRHDEYSRGMDELRADRARLQDWYQREELPKYNAYNQGLADLRRYQEIYGSLDDAQGLNNGGQGGQGGQGNAAPGGSMTKAELEQYLEEKLRQRDGAYVGLTKTAVKIAADYTRRFGDVLDVDAVEKLALEKGLALDQAYKEYVAPKEQTLMETRHKEDIERAKAEAVRDFQSRLKIPVDTKPKESHPFFDRKSPDPKMSELDADRHSREAFMQGWNNYEAEMKPGGGGGGGT